MSDDVQHPRGRAGLGPVARRLAATQRVLCVEDEADIASFLRAYFRAAGFDLVHVDPDDRDQVLDAMAEHRPDIVLLDLRLRGFSGHDAYRHIRADPRWAFTPVVMVSASSSSPEGFELDSGLDAFVSKPFNTNVLADLVRDRLAAAAALAERGGDAVLELMTQDDLEARLADEVAVAGDDGTFTFGLVRLVSTDEVLAGVGHDGRDHLLTTVVRDTRSMLPDSTVIGLTESNELAVLFPATPVDTAQPLLVAALDAASGTFEFPGGAEVPVTLACGLADYPACAVDTDGLFMAADAALADAVEHGQLLQRAL